MLVFDKNNEVVILDSIYTPTPIDHIWVLDLALRDFTLAPLAVLEELISPSIELVVDGFKFTLPASWNVLVTDEETMKLDAVEVSELAGREFKVLVYGPNMQMPELKTITANDYFTSHVNVGPSLNKNQMMCHPISRTSWINVAPSDSYNKFLKHLATGDII